MLHPGVPVPVPVGARTTAVDRWQDVLFDQFVPVERRDQDIERGGDRYWWYGRRRRPVRVVQVGLADVECRWGGEAEPPGRFVPQGRSRGKIDRRPPVIEDDDGVEAGANGQAQDDGSWIHVDVTVDGGDADFDVNSNDHRYRRRSRTAVSIRVVFSSETASHARGGTDERWLRQASCR